MQLIACVCSFLTNKWLYFLRLRETLNGFQLPVFFLLLFFCQPCPGLQNCKSLLLILKISHYGGERQRDKLNTWYLYCRKTYGHSAWKGDELVYGLPHIESQNSQSTWSHEIKWQIKHVIFLLPPDLWPLNVARWWLTIKRLPSTKSRNPLKDDLLRSRDQLKTFYLHDRNAWSHQSQQLGDLGWVDSNDIVTWPFE